MVNCWSLSINRLSSGKNNISTPELKNIAYRLVGQYIEREPEAIHEDIYRHFYDKLVSLFDFIPDSLE